MITAETETTATDAAVAAQGANVAPQKASSKKSTSPKKGAPKGQKGAKSSKPNAAATAKPKKTIAAKKAANPTKAARPKDEGAREGSKTARVVTMLQRKNGATLSDLQRDENSCRQNRRHYRWDGRRGSWDRKRACALWGASICNWPLNPRWCPRRLAGHRNSL
jgi:hypothetical protein